MIAVVEDTAGVMIVLTLIPAAALVGVEVMQGNIPAAGAAFFNWLIQAVTLVVVSTLVFAWKRARLHHRKTLF